MNEDFYKVNLGNKRKTRIRLDYRYQSFYIKPSGKFWKRYFNKKVRKGLRYKRGNWFDWS